HDLVGDLDYAMFIVTARDGDRLAGCLVGFTCQTSIDPPRFLVCLSRRNRTYRLAQNADVLAVHFVPRDAEALVELFGGHTDDSDEDRDASSGGSDKFAQVGWRPGPEGVPILQDCGNWFAGTVLERLDLGDHVGFLLEPVQAQRQGGTQYYPFSQAKHIEPGHPA
ncbi:MAG TPA: flavin reductase family protein, partial [Pseudonocardiaceae bacterium]|nr:flavin reductase family protein [Pseudonocardiaceae bacterium]